MSAATEKLTADIAAALRNGDRRGFVRLVVRLLDLHAPLTSGWKSLSIPLFDFGELELARRVMDRYADAVRTSAAQFDRALLYVRTAKPAAAIAILDTIATSIPDEASNDYLRGTIALNLGDRVLARRYLLRAQTARPWAGQILHTLSMLGSLKEDVEVADLIVRSERTIMAGPDEERGSYCYALGKVWNDRGEARLAFDAFQKGAAIVASERPYSADRDAAEAAAATAGWTANRIATIAGKITAPTHRAIVVTGLPRSGTTLLEHILASHSMVVDGDELGRFTVVANEIGGASYNQFEQWAYLNSPNQAAKTYLHLASQRFGKMGRFVDKTLEASRYLGLVAATLPDAPIFWMRRNPLDTAWSCFSTYFLTGLTWSWSLSSLAEHMAMEKHLLDYWQNLLGDRLRIVDYEQLVSAKETHIPEIMKHAHLPMESATLAPETSARLVTTASVSQVRAPINTRAVGRANRYAAHLLPFTEQYGTLTHST